MIVDEGCGGKKIWEEAVCSGEYKYLIFHALLILITCSPSTLEGGFVFQRLGLRKFHRELELTPNLPDNINRLKGVVNVSRSPDVR